MKEKLDVYLTGELPRRVQEKVKIHLESCQDCQKALVGLRRLAAALDGTPAPPIPKGFAGRVMARARSRVGQKKPFWATVELPFRWWMESAFPLRVGTAAVLALGLTVGLLMGRDTARGRAACGPAPEDADLLAVYNVDYLEEAPSGSLAAAYLALASGRNGERP
jgi:anti-sigma factor RsiW